MEPFKYSGATAPGYHSSRSLAARTATERVDRALARVDRAVVVLRAIAVLAVCANMRAR